MTAATPDVDVALNAAAAGAAVVRAAYGGDLTRQGKAGRDFATNADLDAERAIIDALAQARPDDRSGRLGSRDGRCATSSTGEGATSSTGEGATSSTGEGDAVRARPAPPASAR